MMGSEIEISVVVPAYNDAGRLRNLMDSFDQIAQPEGLEIIIVDDCSQDETEQVCRAWEASPHGFVARYRRMEQNGGPGRARNEGLALARGKYIAFTDSDCRVHPDWPRALTAGIDEDNRVVGVGGRVYAVSEDSFVVRHFILHGTLEPPRIIAYMVTCNCCFLRQPLVDIGGFPADIRMPGGEDVELSIRLWKQGWRFTFRENAIIYHDFDTSFRGFCKTWYYYGYGCSLVAHRLLVHEELYPPSDTSDLPNFWPGYLIRPPVTGVRSFFRDIQYDLWICRRAKVNLARVIESLIVLAGQRVIHAWGWHKGKQRCYQEAKRHAQTGA